MTMKDLREQRSRLVADLRKITETPEGSDGDLPGDQAQRFDVLKAELKPSRPAPLMSWSSTSPASCAAIPRPAGSPTKSRSRTAS